MLFVNFLKVSIANFGRPVVTSVPVPISHWSHKQEIIAKEIQRNVSPSNRV